MSGYPDYRSRPSYRYPDYPELRYRSSSHPRTSTYQRSTAFADYTSPRRRSSSRDPYTRYREDDRHFASYSHDPREYREYARQDSFGGAKDFYQPRSTYDYYPHSHYNQSGYGDYSSARRSGYSSYGNYGGSSEAVQVQKPYVSPMGYKTVSDRRRFNCWDSHRYGEMRDSTYRNRRNESYGWGPADYGHRPRRSGAYSSRHPSDYYPQPAPPPVRRVAWEDLSTSALNYRDSSRSRSLPHFGAYSDGYGGGYSSLPRGSGRPQSSMAEYRGVHDATSRYRDRGGIDYGADYGDNYSSYANGGGGLAGGYGLSSRSNPEIAHRKYYEQDVLDYERYWDGRY